MNAWRQLWRLWAEWRHNPELDYRCAWRELAQLRNDYAPASSAIPTISWGRKIFQRVRAIFVASQTERN